jgi:hypothetical protein
VPCANLAVTTNLARLSLKDRKSPGAFMAGARHGGRGGGRGGGGACGQGTKVATFNGRGFGWEVAHGAVTRRPPIYLFTIVPRTAGYTYDVGVWDLSIVQRPFSVAPCQNLESRFATFASLYQAQELRAAAGFSHVFQLLLGSGKPAVGHNCMLDVLYTMRSFQGALPATWEEFHRTAASAFTGGLYDTKHVARQHGAVSVCYGDGKKSRIVTFGWGLVVRVCSALRWASMLHLYILQSTL